MGFRLEPPGLENHAAVYRPQLGYKMVSTVAPIIRMVLSGYLVLVDALSLSGPDIIISDIMEAEDSQHRNTRPEPRIGTWSVEASKSFNWVENLQIKCQHKRSTYVRYSGVIGARNRGSRG